MMNVGQDGTTTASRADRRHHTPESMLFINTVVGPEASQASIRKKARSHIMTQYHKKAREMRVSKVFLYWFLTILTSFREWSDLLMMTQLLLPPEEEYQMRSSHNLWLLIQYRCIGLALQLMTSIYKSVLMSET